MSVFWASSLALAQPSLSSVRTNYHDTPPGRRLLIESCVIAAMGASFSFVKAASANIREKDDSLNPALGGLIAGAILGTKCMGNRIWDCP